MTLLEHSPFTGQSLSIGGGNDQQPGFSIVAENDAREALDDGTLPLLKVKPRPGGDPDHLYFSQAPMHSCGYRLRDELTDGRIVGMSSHGSSGATLAQISKGGSTGSYEALLARVQNVRTAALGRGDTYNLRALHLVQGEADISASTSQAAWRDRLVQYRDDLMADAALDSLLVVMSQTSTQDVLPTEAVDIENAQLEVHRTYPWAVLVGPHYALERYGVPQLHLTPVGYYHLGELHARASLAKIEAGVWNPVMPATVEVLDSITVQVQFLVPVPPLVFDTTLVPAQDHMGFSFLNTSALVASVEITAPNTVTITADRPLAAGAVLGYAADTDKGRGNLRDSETAVSVHDGAPLPNWSVIFTETLSIGANTGTAYEIQAIYYVGDDSAIYEVNTFPGVGTLPVALLTEDPPGSGLYTIDPGGAGTLTENPGGSGLYDYSAGGSTTLTEDPPGSGLYTIGS